MTDEEAIAFGRTLARRRGWAWREPSRVLRQRRGFAGPEVLVVLTTTNRRGECIRVEVDARSGTLLDADFDVR